MSENSKIEWTDHTFNPWIGCTKVSPGCAQCYAETLMDTRYGRVKWGKGQPRQRTSAANWKLPLRWNREWAKYNWPYRRGDKGPLSRPPRVFCASLADWLDDEVPIEWLADLLALIYATPNLDWLLLTKRPENWKARMMEAAGCLRLPGNNQGAWRALGWGSGGTIPQNVWVGTTVEDQTRADERIPHLLKIPAKVRFLSCEPLLGPVDILKFSRYPMPANCLGWHSCADHELPALLHWVICGGESGKGKVRPMHPEWARSLRDQCAAAGVPFLFKQWGEWAPSCAQYPRTEDEHTEAEEAGNYGDIALEPNGTIPEGYQPISPRTWLMNRVGKKAAGRLLDGREHNEFPRA